MIRTRRENLRSADIVATSLLSGTEKLRDGDTVSLKIEDLDEVAELIHHQAGEIHRLKSVRIFWGRVEVEDPKTGELLHPLAVQHIEDLGEELEKAKRIGSALREALAELTSVMRAYDVGTEAGTVSQRLQEGEMVLEAIARGEARARAAEARGEARARAAEAQDGAAKGCSDAD